jgi:hypothetical protein
VSNFYLQPGDGTWSDLFTDQNAIGCILVDINAAGRRYCVGTMDITLMEVTDVATPGRRVHFVGAVVNDPVHAESVDPFSRESSVQSMRIDVLGDHLPLRELRKSGVLLQDVDVDVYWYVARHDFGLDQSFLVLSGKMIAPRFDERSNTSSFTVEDTRLRGEIPFPPVVATTDLIADLRDEDSGKPYPIVIGSVKKLPLLDVSGGTVAGNDIDDFLVMLDALNEWSSPAQVSAIWDGDAAMAEAVGGETQETDTDGNSYIQVVTQAGASSLDVTADVDGHTPATPGEAIRYLLTFFGNDADIFNDFTPNDVDMKMGAITLAMAFNSRSRKGVLDVLRDRLCRQLPIVMIQRGDKYTFEPILWDRNVVKHLRTDVNIVRKTQQPTETRQNEIRNNFALHYAISGLRGDYTGCVTADETSSHECAVSVRRYGESAPYDVKAPDVADLTGARWLLNWMIETYSKMRVFVGYRCTLDAINVRLLDTVMVTDEYEEWTETLFKVIGIRRGTGPWIDLDLVSIEDYTSVYDVNE